MKAFPTGFNMERQSTMRRRGAGGREEGGEGGKEEEEEVWGGTGGGGGGRRWRCRRAVFEVRKERRTQGPVTSCAASLPPSVPPSLLPPSLSPLLLHYRLCSPAIISATCADGKEGEVASIRCPGYKDEGEEEGGS